MSPRGSFDEVDKQLWRRILIGALTFIAICVVVGLVVALSPSSNTRPAPVEDSPITTAIATNRAFLAAQTGTAVAAQTEAVFVPTHYAATVTALASTPSAPPARTPAAQIVPTATIGANRLVTDPQGRFTFTRPSGWASFPPSGTNSAVRLESSSGTLVVAAVPGIPAGTSHEQIVQFFVKEVQGYNGYRAGPIGRREMTLGGEQTTQYDFYTTSNGQEFYTVTFIIEHSGTSYLLFFNFPATGRENDSLPSEVSIVLNSWVFTPM